MYSRKGEVGHALNRVFVLLAAEILVVIFLARGNEVEMLGDKESAKDSRKNPQTIRACGVILFLLSLSRDTGKYER